MNMPNRLAMLLLLALAPLSYSQEQPRENLSAKGTFRGGFSGGFAFASDSNETWKVKLPPKASEISFSANAEPSFLRPGMKVTFSAVINKKGVAKEPVSALTVFTPQEPKDIGVWPEGAGESAPNPLENLFSPKEIKQEPKAKGKKPVIEDQVCRVGGTLKSFKGDRLVVVAGRMEVKCQLTENAKIRVATSDLSFVQLGDKVEVEGWYYANAKQAGLWANSVSITAANPLTGEKKKTKPSDDDPKDRPASNNDKEAKQDK
jgi:hypothetical protein